MCDERQVMLRTTPYSFEKYMKANFSDENSECNFSCGSVSVESITHTMFALLALGDTVGVLTLNV